MNQPARGLLGCFLFSTEKRWKMDQTLDIFEKLPEGSSIWRAAVNGPQNAIGKLQELSLHFHNELYVVDLRTKTVIATTITGSG
jgi:hypothetical protein